MPLLARRVQVRPQHPVDQRRDRAPARATPAPGPSAGPAPATPAPPAPSAGAPRAPGRSPGPPSPAGDPPGSPRTVPPCPVPSALRDREAAECDHYARSRTTCPATSPACRRNQPHGRGQIRGELIRPARSQVEPNQRRRWSHFRVTRPPICSAGRITARSKARGGGRTGDLGPCRPGPTPAEPRRGSAIVKIAQGKGTRRDTEGEPEPGNGRRGQNRRTPDDGKPEEGGRRGRTRRANGKPEESPRGEPEDVR